MPHCKLSAQKIGKISRLRIPIEEKSQQRAKWDVTKCETLFGSKMSSNNSKETKNHNSSLPGRVAQSVTCLATDADPGVASSIPARYHTFVESDHEIISTVI